VAAEGGALTVCDVQNERGPLCLGRLDDGATALASSLDGCRLVIASKKGR
jgi:hypothetical protein